ncbi:MAG: hypothetical protein WCE70_00470 [Rhodanobacteraceae bacterium]
MNWSAYTLAWLLPGFTGAGIWLALNRGLRAHGDWAAALGGGWIVGVFLAATIARWTATADTVHAFADAAPWLGGIGMLAWAIVIWRHRRTLATIASGEPPAQPSRAPGADNNHRWLRWLGCALIALVAWRLLTLGSEALLRPVFPWDAWSAWAVKPKTWFLLGHAVPFVSMADWLARPGLLTHTLSTWDYPELLAWVELWFASAAGTWNEPLVDVVWCGALAALLLAAYGQWRAIGVEAWLAMILVYALASLPLIDAHVALAGYADLWLATTLGLATLAWSRWLICRESGQWLLAIVLALWLPAIKLEGTVWLLGFAALVVLERVPSRWRWRSLFAVATVLLLALLFGDLSLPLPGLGWVHISTRSVDIAALGSFDFGWHPVGRAIVASLFTLPNWHLLWYLLPALVLWRWQRIRDDSAVRSIGALLLLYMLFLFVLFFFTDAAVWAADYTSANRLILQIVPVVFALAAVLLRNDGAACMNESGHGQPERLSESRRMG